MPLRGTRNVRVMAACILRFNEGRDPERLDMKYEAMRQSPFAFFRGTCHLFWEDWPRDSPLDSAPRPGCAATSISRTSAPTWRPSPSGSGSPDSSRCAPGGMGSGGPVAAHGLKAVLRLARGGSSARRDAGAEAAKTILQARKWRNYQPNRMGGAGIEPATPGL